MKSLSFLTPEDPRDRLALTEEEQKELIAIDSKIISLQAEKTIRKREIFRAKGYTTEKLEDLKSRSGEPFVCIGESSFFGNYERASAGKGGDIQYAYHCPGCGWVKGLPNSKDFNTIKFLSGSEGESYHCKICGSKIGETVTKMSLHAMH